METRHIMFDYEEALSARKNILTTEINLLGILKKIKAYKTLRKKELSSKNSLRIQLGNLRKKIDLIQSFLPKQVEIKIKKKTKKKTAKEKGDIQEELDKIKRKLEKLS